MKKLLRTAIEHLPAKGPLFTALRVVRPPKSVYSRLRFKGEFRVPVDGCGAFVMRSHGHGDENAIFWRGLFGGYRKNKRPFCRQESTAGQGKIIETYCPNKTLAR